MALLSVADAKALILAGVAPLAAEQVPLEEAFLRVLAEDLPARLTQPPFDASAMDGYAVRAEDVAAAPVILKVLGESAAGRPFPGRLGLGDAVRIFTGAPMPEGADAVVIQENTQRATGDRVEILEPVERGKNVRPRGGDFSAGDLLLRRGQRLQSRHLMLAAAMNHARLPVARMPTVGLIATGDELKEPGSDLREGEIVSSIPAGLMASLCEWGARARLLGIARDDVESLTSLIERGHGLDILVTIGGASVGDYDLVRPVFESLGVRLQFLKVAIRPGKPMMFGYRGAQRLLGLPGNPVSAAVCAHVFLKPLVKALVGQSGEEEALLELPLTHDLPQNGEREHYMRAVMTLNPATVTPLQEQDSSLIASFARSNCLIRREPFAPAAKKGDVVTVLPLT